ncbi:MAG TPA: hypothetical protein DCP11_02070 [Microbacteriaceae bacterium]|nr:hypothetical protein [Microbacteriaceae bacterium]
MASMFIGAYARYIIGDLGALCIVDTEPRRFSRSDSALLRTLALQVQDELWARAASGRGA